jgi:hypothetical protein
MDSNQPPDLDSILRPILTNALPESASTSNCNDRHQSLLALPSSPDNARATISCVLKEHYHCRRTSRNRCATSQGPSRGDHTTSVLTPTHFEKPHTRHSSNSPILDIQTSTTFKDYVATLPTWEQDLLLHATEKPSTTSLYPSLLPVSDGWADVPKNYGSFVWVIGTAHEILWECKGIARDYPMQYRAEGYGRLSLLSFLTHYILYLEIQASDDLCITSYCDNHSLLKNEETFHTRDIDSSSWYAEEQIT